MEFVLFALAIFTITFVLMMLGFLVSKRRGKKEAAAFQEHVAREFPDLPAPAELLLASQQSRGKPDTALVVADARREIVVLFDRGREGMTHLDFPFSALRRVDSANRIISRGMPPSRVFSYEQTMTVTFADGRSFPFTLEFPSNKHGSDKAPGLVAALFAPWEERLNAILRDTYRAESAPAASTPRQPTPAASAATWGADPYARFDWRYFDGDQWTDQVSRDGHVSTDPPVRTLPLQPAHH